MALRSISNGPIGPVVWVALMVLLAIPIPFRGLLLPERGAIILYLMVGGALLLFWRLIAPASWPLAALLTYGLFHALAAGMFPVLPIQLVILMAMVSVLFVEAARLPGRWARRAGWALLAGAGVQAILGVLNLFHIFPGPTALAIPLAWVGLDPAIVYRWFNSGPWMTLISRDYLGRPMGWMTHPNFWGAYLALAVPVATGLLGRWVGLGLLVLVGTSLSIGPIVSAGVGFLVFVWRDLARSGRQMVVAGVIAVVAVVSVVHISPRIDPGKSVTLEQVTSGRTNVWAAAVPKLLEQPVLGHGLGSWRLWAEEYNRVVKTEFATRQAHNEPLQLVFELGLVGLLLVAALLWHLGAGVARLYRDGAHDEWMWAAVLVAAVVNSIGSPTFHMPTTAGVAVFAAARILAAKEAG